VFLNAVVSNAAARSVAAGGVRAIPTDCP